MRAIPKRLLIHSIKLIEKGQKDRWGNADETEQAVNHVRIEPSTAIVRDKNNAEIQLAAVLFYDVINSRPRNIAFKVDQIIDFNDERYAVKSVESLYDGCKLHHYELGMIKHA